MSSVQNESSSKKRQKTVPPPPDSISTSTPLASNVSNRMVPAHPTASNSNTVDQLGPKKTPTGDRLDLKSAAALLAWLKERMDDPAQLVSGPNILSPESMMFTLEGREQAMDKIESCLQKIYVSSTRTSKSRDRNDYPFPVCSEGMSGHEDIEGFTPIIGESQSRRSVPTSLLAS